MAKTKASNIFAYGIMFLLFTSLVVFVVVDPLGIIRQEEGTGLEKYPAKIMVYAEDMLTGQKISSASIKIYTYEFGDYVLQEIITTGADGSGTSIKEYEPGTVLYIQGTASGYYTTALKSFTVRGAPAERATVYLGSVKMLAISSSVSLTGQADTTALSDDGTVSTSDDAVTVSLIISGLTPNKGYGAPEDYPNVDNGKWYKGGIILVVKINSSIAKPAVGSYNDYKTGIDNYMYFIFYLPNVVDDFDDPNDGILSVQFTLEFSATGSIKIEFAIYDALLTDAINALSFGTADADLTNITMTYS